MGPGGRAWIRAVLTGVALVATAACSGGGDGADGAGDDFMLRDEADDSTTTTAPSGEQRTGSGATTTSATRQTTTTTRRGSGTTTTTTSGGTTSTTRAGVPGDSGARGVPGAYARTLLQAARAQRVVIEPLVQQGAEPRQATVDHLVALVRDVSGKPVTVAGTVALPAGDGTTTDADIRSLSDQHGRSGQTAEQAVVRVLFLTGRYSPTSSVLGVAVRGDTAAVFTQQVRQAATPLVTAAGLERAVAAHELGHLLGLVDLVIDTGRDDPEHEGHSRNPESVMYWAIESSLVGQVLNGPPPSDFDADDRADLAAIRNGA